jgi:hypothetical protein
MNLWNGLADLRCSSSATRAKALWVRWRAANTASLVALEDSVLGSFPIWDGLLRSLVSASTICSVLGDVPTEHEPIGIPTQPRSSIVDEDSDAVLPGFCMGEDEGIQGVPCGAAGRVIAGFEMETGPLGTVLAPNATIRAKKPATINAAACVKRSANTLLREYCSIAA